MTRTPRPSDGAGSEDWSRGVPTGTSSVDGAPEPVQVADSGQYATDASIDASAQVAQDDKAEGEAVLGAAARRIIVQRAIDERRISPEEGNQYLANADAWDISTAKSFNALTRSVARVPPEWVADEADGLGGVLYRNPADPEYDTVRIMPGDPQNSNPGQQQPYVIDQKSGRFLTKDGTRVEGSKREEVHIPLQDYRFDKR